MIPLTMLDGTLRDTKNAMVDTNGYEKFRHIELEINTVCDLDCFGCDRMIDVSSAPAMTVEQVKYFIEESLDLKWEWERIRLLGGEPTLHKDFEKLVGLLIQYRNEYPNVFLQVLTNGLGKSKQYEKPLEKLGVSLHAERKEKGITPSWFRNTRIVPIDRVREGDEDSIGALEPCGIFGIRGCGIGLTNHGYFLDGAGASIARIAGHDIGIMHLKDVTYQAMMDQSKILCRICGHWNPMEGEEVTEQITKTGKITGRFWTKTLEEYKRNKPKLKMYGPKSNKSLEVLI